MSIENLSNELSTASNSRTEPMTVTSLESVGTAHGRLEVCSERAQKLLVVDDNSVNRELLSRRLELQGYEVNRAENGREAMEMVKRSPYDLVLLDIMMPDVDGYQVLRLLKSDIALREIPVIIISALGDLDSIVRCIEIGAED